MDDKGYPAERRSRHSPRSTRAPGALGRRKEDQDPRTTLTRKVVVITVALVNFAYLVGEAVLFGAHACP